MRGITGKGLADVDTSLDPHLSLRLARSRREKTLQILCNDSQQVSAHNRATLQGIGITVVSPDLILVKVTKKEKEAGQQVSARSAVCSLYVYLG